MMSFRQESCIGIAPTKTLAKLANHVAKSAERKPGSYPAHHAQICNLGAVSDKERTALLQATEVGEIWGVGRKLSAQLNQAGIHTAHDLAQADPVTIQRRWSIVLAKTVRELNGNPRESPGFQIEARARACFAKTEQDTHPSNGSVPLLDRSQ